MTSKGKGRWDTQGPFLGTGALFVLFITASNNRRDVSFANQLPPQLQASNYKIIFLILQQLLRVYLIFFFWIDFK